MPNDIFNRTDKTLARKLAKNKFGEFERNRNTLLKAVGTDMAQLIGPALIDAAKTILGKQTIQVEAPQVHVPAPIVNVQAPPAPDVIVPAPIANVTVPPIKIPDINIPQMKWPEGEMPIKGKVTLEGINEGSPLSVQIRDSKGKPVDFSAGGNTIFSSGGGGIAKQVRINNTSSNPVPITGSLTVAAAASTFVIPGNRDGEIYNSDNPLPVTASITGFTDSIAASLIDSSGVQYSGSNPLPVSATIGSVTITDIEDGAGDSIMDAANDAMYVNIKASTGTLAANIVDSTGIAYSGSNPVPVGGTITAVTGITNTVAANIVDSTGVAYTTTNPLPIDDAGGAITVDGTVTVSDVTASVKSALIDSSGVQYSGSNPVPVAGAVTMATLPDTAGGDLADIETNTDSLAVVGGGAEATALRVTIANDSTGVVSVDDGGGALTVDGTVVVSSITASTGTNILDSSGVAYSGSNPVPITEVVTRASYKTAYASLTNGTETTLLTGEASYYHDLVWVMCANQSDVAITVDFRETTGGTIMATIQVPASGTAGIAPTLPLPQSNISGAWTADMDDITGTTVDITALFKKEL